MVLKCVFNKLIYYMSYVYLNLIGHNGDIMHSSNIIHCLVKSNPLIKFRIVVSCSNVLFKNLESLLKIQFFNLKF